VGRKRKDDSLRLPQRLYVRAGTFYYVHPVTNVWENVGKDLAIARKRAEHYNDPSGEYGTMAWYLDQFIIECGKRVLANDLSPRTLEDYTGALVPLKAYFGKMLPIQLGPHHVVGYLEDGVKLDRAVRANREKACLSSCISWMLRTNQAGGLTTNPCMRASGVTRNEEESRDRYVTHAEYLAVHAVAPRQVKLMMELTYRTLQRPQSDILQWTPAVIRNKAEGRVLHFRQKKTGRLIDIGLDGRLAELIDQAVGVVPQLHQPIVHTLKGKAYTYGGLLGMLNRAIVKARAKTPALRAMEPFGFRDLKGKGATDMWVAGEPIERIQLLCGHADKSTTEIYIKARWRETAASNAIKIA
jgi:integrase